MKPIAETLARIQSLYLKGQHDRAFDLAIESLQSHPDVGEIWELLGLLHCHRGAHDHAMRALERATTLAPLSIRAQLVLAHCYRKAGFVESASAIYVYLAATAQLPVGCVGVVVRELQQLNECHWALKVCRDWVRMTPDCDEPLAILAELMSHCGYPPETVLSVHERVVQLAPRVPAYRVGLGCHLMRMGRGAEAYATLSSLNASDIAQLSDLKSLKDLEELFQWAGDQDRYEACRRRENQLASESLTARLRRRFESTELGS